MKNFAIKHPIFTGIIIFIGISVICFILSLSIAVYLMRLHSSGKPPIPNDPNDGDAMGAGFLIYLGTLAGIIFGFIFGLIAAFYLSFRKNKAFDLP